LRVFRLYAAVQQFCLTATAGSRKIRLCAAQTKKQRDAVPSLFPEPDKELKMISTPAQVAEFQKSQLDALFALSHTMFEATEKLVDLNLAATKALLEESAEKTQVMLGVKDPQELLTVGSGLAQPALEKVVSYNRNVYGIASGAGADLSKIFETQIAQSNKQIADMIELASKNTPTGAEPAVSMVKSALAAANTAYDTFSKATKQAVDMAESNFNAATAATVKAANDAVKPAKGRKAA
jgi:phasin family protein